MNESRKIFNNQIVYLEENILKRIQKAIDAPRNIGGINYTVKASIGYALYSETTYLTALIERADQRMYDMKKEHKASR